MITTKIITITIIAIITTIIILIILIIQRVRICMELESGRTTKEALSLMFWPFHTMMEAAAVHVGGSDKEKLQCNTLLSHSRRWLFTWTNYLRLDKRLLEAFEMAPNAPH